MSVLIVLTVAGCSGQVEGPQRYTLSGTVTYAGKPVPEGEIIITPDSSTNNSGLGSYATIKDGHFETAPGKGVAAGDYHLSVTGFDGVPYKSEDGGETFLQGKTLFADFKLKQQFQSQDETLNIEVPAGK
ncbi:hypothetical protein [Gimesia sp.]|uniref:hypothetical protein n=1 Tax=Gimesia sp. TaxID=2024833 RepID=UPI003A943AC0